MTLKCAPSFFLPLYRVYLVINSAPAVDKQTLVAREQQMTDN